MLALLRVGTSLERIGDESVTPSDSGFVHRNIYADSMEAAPHAESLKRMMGGIRQTALTFARSTLRRRSGSRQDSEIAGLSLRGCEGLCGAFWRFRLTIRPNGERIGDESALGQISRFVHRKMWCLRSAPALAGSHYAAIGHRLPDASLTCPCQRGTAFRRMSAAKNL